MAAKSLPAHTSIPFWRDTRVIAMLLQVVFLLLVLSLLFFLYNNMMAGLTRSNLAPNFAFLSQEAGIAISGSPLPYTPSDSYGWAFIIGIVNTLQVALVGVVLATILGIVLGICRLSSNWLLRNTAMVYVEIVRNVPLLLQLFFWFALTRTFPRVQESINFFGLLFLHNRGVTLAAPGVGPSFGAWLPWLVGALVLGAAAYMARRMQLARQDRPGAKWPWALLAVLVTVLLGWLVVSLTAGAPLFLSVPEQRGFNFVGGITVSSNYTALLLGLVVYTAVFIGEIVRSGILAVSKGQREAARALGLTTGQTLRLVIFPQALRIMIPPLTSQYLNLTKNSTLAIGVGYLDLYNIAQTINNQTGQAVPVILMLMGSFLTVSLTTSLLMNWYNKRIQLVER